MTITSPVRKKKRELEKKKKKRRKEKEKWVRKEFFLKKK